ncbi:MAG: acetyl-CoA carboxylase carboxyltransferase subunit alpha [Tenericutes bacterium GWC2_34_14]|nr:MAG: acetyl-CoA carboxylase carboxyltransferase subunit alpha [Tenericutes bacterium GWA2_35_7]OHE28287.1 MAG: acetyl-CoA carboxylase carboxyltransferase subunit alpha [Tenericutes bacterium GWC2_34_14]OHE33086.1 MAG: acetyl-CoA carboxylase carboxyltransferase subunit alpha [Tenericutes bacterium GWE2_34_108]OHE36206.1 MAG: acetyl-CoA carboxylase carboxyltransferase subunit alpha [Tenericutes bacterium GWF1_35_14]OHE38751.1 MAG: acetyl-CoA carboxylase carboxyltransferase subunit alpha [Tener
MTKMELTAWEKVKLARHPKRPTSIKVIKEICPDFVELHGDRLFSDDHAIIGGIATLNGQSVTIIAEEKGVSTEEKIKHNFGMPHPEGYRKALRLMKQAEKFKRPIICIIDTPGAYPGIGAEERGQASAIATNLREMMGLKTPIIVVVLSEGGSGGALAIGVGDHIMMFENSVYAILSPEGFASIIYKDSQKADVAAQLMKLTASDLASFNVIDQIILEHEGLHIDPDFGMQELKKALVIQLKKLKKMSISRLLDERYQKFRRMGTFLEKGEHHESST